MKHIIVLVLALVTSIAFAAHQYPWADTYIHTDPVLERGLGPEAVTTGYSLINLTDIGRDGEAVDGYEAWTEGKAGHRVWLTFRPGENVEAKCTGSREITRGITFTVETYEAKRIARCGNPTAITFYVWKQKAITVTKIVPGPPTTQNIHADVDANIKVAPIDVNANVNVAPIKVDVHNEPIDVNVRVAPINVNLSQQPTPQPVIIVNNTNISYTPQNFACAQMLGVYGPTMNSWQILGASTSTPMRISLNNGNNIGITNNNSNTNVNSNANNNTINVGDGSAHGSSDASGTGTANSGH